MQLLIDSADLEKIKQLYAYYPVDGVTTNPSILARSGRPPYEVLQEIRAFIGDEAQLHAQVVSDTAEQMVAEGHEIARRLGKQTYIKIPVVPEGLKAIRILKQEGYRVTATAIYTPMQAYLAAKAGADYAAPYVNRMELLTNNGISSAQAIQTIFWENGFDTQVLAASFKTVQQVQSLCEFGIDACTISPQVMEAFLQNDAVTAALEVFQKDFQNLCGEGKTMLNCDV